MSNIMEGMNKTEQIFTKLIKNTINKVWENYSNYPPEIKVHFVTDAIISNKFFNGIKENLGLDETLKVIEDTINELLQKKQEQRKEEKQENFKIKLKTTKITNIIPYPDENNLKLYENAKDFSYSIQILQNPNSTGYIISLGGTIGTQTAKNGTRNVQKKDGFITEDSADSGTQDIILGKVREVLKLLELLKVKKEKKEIKNPYIILRHGTDTMVENFSAVFPLLGEKAKEYGIPIIFTGSMDSPDTKSTDAHMNFFHALNIGNHFSQQEIGGVFMVFGGKIYKEIQAKEELGKPGAFIDKVPAYIYIFPYELGKQSEDLDENYELTLVSISELPKFSSTIIQELQKILKFNGISEEVSNKLVKKLRENIEKINEILRKSNNKTLQNLGYYFTNLSMFQIFPINRNIQEYEKQLKKFFKFLEVYILQGYGDGNSGFNKTTNLLEQEENKIVEQVNNILSKEYLKSTKLKEEMYLSSQLRGFLTIMEALYKGKFFFLTTEVPKATSNTTYATKDLIKLINENDEEFIKKLQIICETIIKFNSKQEDKEIKFLKQKAESILQFINEGKKIDGKILQTYDVPNPVVGHIAEILNFNKDDLENLKSTKSGLKFKLKKFIENLLRNDKK